MQSVRVFALLIGLGGCAIAPPPTATSPPQPPPEFNPDTAAVNPTTSPAGATPSASPVSVGCERDTDCPGDQLCDNRSCVSDEE